MATANEKRIAVRNKYREILGRNNYSQAKRDYCFRKYSDGKYYSDCSSSISYCYKECGYSFGILNTVGMYESNKLTTVPVVIKNGQIQNPEILRIGDMLLFAGGDSGRKYAGYVGHVEMVGEINGSTITLYGHGSGNPSKKNMTIYCKTRYNTKSSTALGHRGLIKVVRFIQDDGSEKPTAEKLSTEKPNEVLEAQKILLKLGYNLPKYGADGEYGSETASALMAYQKDNGLTATGELDKVTLAHLFDDDTSKKTSKKTVKIVNGNCYVRDAGNTRGKILGVAKIGTELPYGGETDKDTNWNSVEYYGQKGWVSPLYSKVV